MIHSLKTTLTLAATAGLFIGSTSLAGSLAPPIHLVKGGTFCFSFQQPRLPEWRETFKLVVQPVSADAARDFMSVNGRRPWIAVPPRLPGAGVMSVDGMQHGLLTGAAPVEYISVQTGTAALDLAGTGLIVSLTSNQSGLSPDQTTPGIWVANIAMTLDARTLSGTALGFKQFWPVSEDVVGGPASEAVDGELTPISCAEF